MSNSQQKDYQLCTSDIAFQETLNLLDWPTVCNHLATFASTPQGQRNCKKLEFPKDISATQRRLSETLEIDSLDKTLEEGLGFQGVNDIAEIILHCSKGGVSSGENLLKVSETLRSARRIRRLIEDQELRPCTTSIVRKFSTLPELEKTLQFGIEDGGHVADRASEKLSQFRSRIKTLRKTRKEILHDLLQKNSAILQDNVISERGGRPVLALKVGSSDQISGVVHDTSASGNTIFLEPQVVIALGNQILETQNQILEEENRLLSIWSKLVAGNFSSINNLSKLLLKLEHAHARARYGNWLGGVIPSVSDCEGDPFLIKEFRHPLLAWQHHYGTSEAVVPVSFEVSSGVKVVAITGPNTGGKTIALKSFGLAVLMAKAGMLLPCTGSPSMPWCSQVLADIGDEQSLQQNLSTFSGHIVRIRRILEAIARRPGPTVVLLDEVGAGTDPTEGSAIAIALLRTLASRSRLTLATTHLGELKALKYNDARFENASVAFDSETIKPTYHLQWGIPGRSNAIAIAIRLGLDLEITNTAENLIGPKGLQDVDQVIMGLEDQRQRQQKASEDAAALLARTELLYEELMESWEQQQRNSMKWQQAGRQELETSIKEAQMEVRNLIRCLRDEQADGDTARKAGQRLKQMQRNSLKKVSIPKANEWEPKVGDRVRVLTLGKAGEVVSISDNGSQLTVLCGIFRSTVDLSSVETLDGRKASVSKPSVKVNLSMSNWNGSSIRTLKNTVDVRGLRVDEAEIVVEENLRNAVGKVWIVHGIGSGKLKRGLRQWLQTLPYVEQVTDADQGDGGAGCSVIWLQ